jgi:hypothetical protein
MAGSRHRPHAAALWLVRAFAPGCPTHLRSWSAKLGRRGETGDDPLRPARRQGQALRGRPRQARAEPHPGGDRVQGGARAECHDRGAADDRQRAAGEGMRPALLVAEELDRVRVRDRGAAGRGGRAGHRASRTRAARRRRAPPAKPGSRSRSRLTTICRAHRYQRRPFGNSSRRQSSAVRRLLATSAQSTSRQHYHPNRARSKPGRSHKRRRPPK